MDTFFQDVQVPQMAMDTHMNNMTIQNQNQIMQAQQSLLDSSNRMLKKAPKTNMLKMPSASIKAPVLAAVGAAGYGAYKGIQAYRNSKEKKEKTASVSDYRLKSAADGEKYRYNHNYTISKDNKPFLDYRVYHPVEGDGAPLYGRMNNDGSDVQEFLSPEQFGSEQDYLLHRNAKKGVNPTSVIAGGIMGAGLPIMALKNSDPRAMKRMGIGGAIGAGLTAAGSYYLNKKEYDEKMKARAGVGSTFDFDKVDKM